MNSEKNWLLSIQFTYFEKKKSQKIYFHHNMVISHRYLIFFFQNFNPNTCQCECSDQQAIINCLTDYPDSDRNSLKFWDETSCQCRCTEQYKRCSTNYIYDNLNTCSCIRESDSGGFKEGSTIAIVLLIVAFVVTIGTNGYLFYR